MLWRCVPGVRLVCAALLLAAVVRAGDPAPQPDVVTVCEVLAAPDRFNHKNVFLLGRVSKRENGRWMGEDACAGMAAGPKTLTIHFDRQAGPLPPDQFALNTAMARVKFREVAQHTSLQEFRFGSGDYDRWAIVFGRVSFEENAPQSGGVLCRGEAMIFLWGGAVR